MHDLSEAFKKKFGIRKVVSAFAGGQKLVYIVVDDSGVTKALKVFRNYSDRDRQEIEILQRYSTASGISNIVGVEEFDGQLIIFEEYIDAPDLENIVANYIGNAEMVSGLIREISEILDPVWSDRIVHRDLKPTNIKILPSGSPVIMDFGIARDLDAESITETGDGQPMTWSYAGPEQYAGDKSAISYRTDFFSLGIIAYFLYYNRLPFGATKDDVAVKFDSKDNSIESDDECTLNLFFEKALAFDVSLRPRNKDAFISTLP